MEPLSPDDVERENEALMFGRVFKDVPQIPVIEIKGEPQAAELESPVAAETLPPIVDEKAQVQKKKGISFPMPATRPQPPTKIRKDGSVIVAEKLAEQMGTSPEIKQMMRIDERKFAVIGDLTLAALSHFSYRYAYDGVRYWGHVVEWWLTGSQGVGGIGRKHVLQLMANSSGVQTTDKAKKPNVVARNLWNKDWKKKAEMRGETVPDE